MHTQYLAKCRLSSQPLAFIESPQPQAGFPSPAAEYAETTLDLVAYLVDNPTATFYLRARGDSMIDAQIFEHDILVVDRSRTPSRAAEKLRAEGLLARYLHVFIHTNRCRADRAQYSGAYAVKLPTATDDTLVKASEHREAKLRRELLFQSGGLGRRHTLIRGAGSGDEPLRIRSSRRFF